jgi:hypothetical protein
MAEHLLSMNKALDLIPSTVKKKNYNKIVFDFSVIVMKKK